MATAEATPGIAGDLAAKTEAMAALSLRDGGRSDLEAKYSKRVLVKTILKAPDGGVSLVGKTVTVGGWVKTGREQGKGSFAFLEVNDGSCPANLQVLVDASVHPLQELTPTGTSVLVEGVLSLPPEGTKQKVELKTRKVLHVGTVMDPSKYPLAKTKLSLEHLRSFVHLRPRTNTISAVARIRNALAFASHTFFNQHGFLYVHAPILTTSDCEGAGEMFQATTLLSEAERFHMSMTAASNGNEVMPSAQERLEAARAAVEAEGEKVRQLKAEKKDKKTIAAAVEVLNKMKELVAEFEVESRRVGGLPRTESGKIDYTSDFFGRQAYLTVSGQLHAETYACSLSNVYTFGPTFRAENSHTTRHLAEFWMIEPEMAFADLEDDMNCAEDYAKFLCQWLLDHCLDDMELMAKLYDKAAVDRLRMVATTPFERITYTDAIEVLKKVQAEGRKFENNVEWGIDLASEHERCLTEEIFKKPVIVYNYPKDIKAFYMRVNEDGKTVAAMDVLAPKVGELMGGSQREERYDVLVKRLHEMNLPIEPYQWYLDLRKYGTVKHSGFGLGFERMILFVTGMENIRDVIPFPRFPRHADL
ncbi:hypothetical protein CBR_g12968 [Chara braunii]|uniref:asparagine--tRNA ligase n=1 Tax=Chara braunii TaxID=69332 RepID=A0A388KT64_CHABU|nr:hypothetical protein CBR_g12968 [Chara braunii]|eukprot:GBG73250.1 hypothetical protein CBR_g12968 [Chara braunii]